MNKENIEIIRKKYLMRRLIMRGNVILPHSASTKLI